MAIFQNTEHALHASYLILAHTPGSGSGLRRVLIQALEMLPTLSPAQQAQMESLRGGRSRMMEYADLNVFELRAQCAKVATLVDRRLSAVDRAVVLAKYGHSEQRLRGIADLAAALESDSTVARDAVTMLIMRRYVPQIDWMGAGLDLSFRAIGKATGVSKSAIQRTDAWLGSQFEELEDRAARALDAVFMEHGVTPVAGCAAPLFAQETKFQ